MPVSTADWPSSSWYQSPLSVSCWPLSRPAVGAHTCSWYPGFHGPHPLQSASWFPHTHDSAAEPHRWTGGEKGPGQYRFRTLNMKNVSWRAKQKTTIVMTAKHKSVCSIGTQSMFLHNHLTSQLDEMCSLTFVICSVLTLLFVLKFGLFCLTSLTVHSLWSVFSYICDLFSTYSFVCVYVWSFLSHISYRPDIAVLLGAKHQVTYISHLWQFIPLKITYWRKADSPNLSSLIASLFECPLDLFT